MLKNLINNFKISTRLKVGFAGTLLLIISLNIIGIHKLSTVDNASKELTGQVLQKERLAQIWYENSQINITKIISMAKTNDKNLANFYKPQIAETVKKIDEAQKKLESIAVSDQEKDLFNTISLNRKEYFIVRTKVLELNEKNETEQAIKLIDEQMIPLVNKYMASLSKVVDFYQEESKNFAIHITNEYESGRNLLITLAVLASLVSAVVAWFLAKSILVPITEALKLTEIISQGDLRTNKIVHTGKDELGDLLNHLEDMRNSLANTIVDIKQNSSNIGLATREIATGNMDLSGRTESQASSIEETASTMEELTSTVRQNANNAQEVNKLTQIASKVTEKGSQLIENVIVKMGSIQETSKKVEEITSVIDSIAFQTNILALNAAVEAARAGEQGRGFAVVATEVRNLAHRSATAAKEIKDLINSSVSQVEEGNVLVNESGSTMKEIQKEINNVSILMKEITLASEEQSLGIGQVNQAVSEMDNMTQQNAALVEEAAAAASSLEEQVHGLNQLINTFTIDNNKENIVMETKKLLPILPVKSPIVKNSIKKPYLKKESLPFTSNKQKPIINNKPIKSVSTKINESDWEEF